jgi:hypothetical protein
MEHGDIAAIDADKASGAPLLRRIARNAVARDVDHRVVFGSDIEPPQTCSFPKKASLKPGSYDRRSILR